MKANCTRTGFHWSEVYVWTNVWLLCVFAPSNKINYGQIKNSKGASNSVKYVPENVNFAFWLHSLFMHEKLARKQTGSTWYVEVDEERLWRSRRKAVEESRVKEWDGMREVAFHV